MIIKKSSGIIIPSYINARISYDSITDSLSGLFLPSGNGFYDCVRKKFSSTNSSTSGFLAGKYGYGKTRKFSNQSTTFATKYDLLSYATIVSILDISLLANYSAIIANHDGADLNGYDFRLGVGATDSVIVMKRANSTSIRFTASTVNLITAPSKNNFVAVTLDNKLIQNAPTFYVNGVKYAGIELDPGAASGQIGASSNPFYIGSRPDAVTYLNGAISLVALFNRILSDREIAALYYNPALLFEQNARKTYSFASSGGAANIAVPSASLALDGQVPVVTVNNNVNILSPSALLALAANVPVVFASNFKNIAVPSASLALDGQVPVVTVNNNVNILSPSALLALAANVPVVFASDFKNIAVPSASLALDGQVPVVTVNNNVNILSPSALLALAANVPVVFASDFKNIAVPSASLALAGQRPVVSVNPTIPVTVDTIRERIITVFTDRAADLSALPVRRAERSIGESSDRFVSIWDGEDQAVSLKYGVQRMKFPIAVECIWRSTQHSVEANAIMGEIVKHMLVLNQLNYGIDMKFELAVASPIYPQDGGNYTTVTVIFNVTYETALGDPYYQIVS